MRTRRPALSISLLPLHPTFRRRITPSLATSHLPLATVLCFQPLEHCPPFATLFEPLSFQPVTNCKFCKSFLLITIQPCQGVGGTLPSSSRVPHHLGPLFATDPKKRPLTPIIATLPKAHSRKSFACYTCKTPRGVERPLFSRSFPLSPLTTRHFFFATPFIFTLLHTLLQIFALAQNPTLLFSSNSALFAKKYPGWGM
jgi:hypothetical protein